MTGNKQSKTAPALSSDELSQRRSGHPVANRVPINSIKFQWKNLTSGQKKPSFLQLLFPFQRSLLQLKAQGRGKKERDCVNNAP